MAYCKMAFWPTRRKPVPIAYDTLLRITPPASLGSGCRSTAFASCHALLEKFALHGVACELQCGPKVFTCDFMPSAAQFKLPHRCMIERIASEAIEVVNGPNFFEPT